MYIPFTLVQSLVNGSGPSVIKKTWLLLTLVIHVSKSRGSLFLWFATVVLCSKNN